MLGFLFSRTETATAFLNGFADGRFDNVESGTPVQVGSLLVAVTGPGKINATLATERLLREHDVDPLVHLGPCTALSDEWTPGTLVGISSVLEGDRVELDSPAYPQMPLSLPFETPSEGVLVSQDHTPDNPNNGMGYWARLADVRDEIGYAIAYVAAQHGTPCHIAKALADSSAPSPPEEPPETRDILCSFAQQVATDKQTG